MLALYCGASSVPGEHAPGTAAPPAPPLFLQQKPPWSMPNSTVSSGQAGYISFGCEYTEAPFQEQEPRAAVAVFVSLEPCCTQVSTWKVMPLPSPWQRAGVAGGGGA